MLSTIQRLLSVKTWEKHQLYSIINQLKCTTDSNNTHTNALHTYYK